MSGFLYWSICALSSNARWKCVHVLVTYFPLYLRSTWLNDTLNVHTQLLQKILATPFNLYSISCTFGALCRAADLHLILCKALRSLRLL
jgi:hypothetical protein